MICRLAENISQTLDDSFDVTDAKTRQFTTIPYDEVVEVKKQGSSNGAKIAFGVGIVAVIVILTAIRRDRSGGFCPLGCGPF